MLHGCPVYLITHLSTFYCPRKRISIPLRMDKPGRMKHDIVLVPFPFDNLKTSKVRPAICLTSEVGHYDHLVIAFITSRTDLLKEASDLLLLDESESFKMTGLKTSSMIRLHRLVSVPSKLIRRKLGRLPDALKFRGDLRLKELFDL